MPLCRSQAASLSAPLALLKSDLYLRAVVEFAFFIEQMGNDAPQLRFDIGSRPSAKPQAPAKMVAKTPRAQASSRSANKPIFNTPHSDAPVNANHRSNINPTY